MPDEALLMLAYPATYHAYATPASPISRKLIERARLSAARRIVQDLPAGATVLDVGCGNGALLIAIGALGSYRLLGVEQSPAAADAATARGLTVWRGDLTDAPFEDASIDLVIVNHVLEHVFDPLATLRKIAAVLKAGGRVIGEVPNVDSWDFRVFRALWGGGHAPRHLWHFTPTTLQRALDTCGFAQIEIKGVLHTGHWALSIQNWIRRGRQDTTGLTSGRAWYYPLLLVATIPPNGLQLLLRKTGVIGFKATR